MRSGKFRRILFALIIAAAALSVSVPVYRSGALARLFGGKASNAAPVETLELPETPSGSGKSDPEPTGWEGTEPPGNLQDGVPNGSLQVHFIDVGQGDCTLIICGGEAMLIDAGDDYHGTAVQLYLQKQGVSELKYVIGTHPDADHIGGLDVVITKFDCGAVIMPDYRADTAAYRDVESALEYRDYSVTYPEAGSRYELGEAYFTLLGPVRDYEDSNNNSVSVRLSFGSTAFLFTGDCGEEAEMDMLSQGGELAADVYKAGHHGSSTSTSEELLDRVRPRYAVISCGADNEYGHPHDEVLARLKHYGVKVFRTDLQGTVIAVSDGESISWTLEKDG